MTAAALPPPTRVPAALQEDDEFEEFEQQEWNSAEEDAQDPSLWQDGWEDDVEDDNFTAQLRAELEATEGAAPLGPGLAAVAGLTAMQS